MRFPTSSSSVYILRTSCNNPAYTKPKTKCIHAEAIESNRLTFSAASSSTRIARLACPTLLLPSKRHHMPPNRRNRRIRHRPVWIPPIRHITQHSTASQPSQSHPWRAWRLPSLQTQLVSVRSPVASPRPRQPPHCIFSHPALHSFCPFTVAGHSFLALPPENGVWP